MAALICNCPELAVLANPESARRCAELVPVQSGAEHFLRVSGQYSHPVILARSA